METIERVNDKGKKIKIQPQLHHHLFDFLMEKFPSDKDVKKFVTTFSNGEKKVVIDRLEDPWLPSVACWEASNEDFIRMEEVDYMKFWYHDIVRGWKRPRLARSPVTVPNATIEEPAYPAEKRVLMLGTTAKDTGEPGKVVPPIPLEYQSCKKSMQGVECMPPDGTGVNIQWPSIDATLDIFRDNMRDENGNMQENEKMTSFLDIGSGTGRWLCQVLAHFPNAKAFGIEKSENCVTISRRHLDRNRATILHKDVHKMNNLDGIEPSHVVISSPGMNPETQLKILYLLNDAKNTLKQVLVMFKRPQAQTKRKKSQINIFDILGQRLGLEKEDWENGPNKCENGITTLKVKYGSTFPAYICKCDDHFWST